MSDIGPGDIVQAVRSGADNSLTVGGIYRVVRFVQDSADHVILPCLVCNEVLRGVSVDGKPDGGVVRWRNGELAMGFGYCPCAFRKWPPPADAALLSEDVDTDVKEPV